MQDQTAGKGSPGSQAGGQNRNGRFHRRERGCGAPAYGIHRTAAVGDLGRPGLGSVTRGQKEVVAWNQIGSFSASGLGKGQVWGRDRAW